MANAFCSKTSDCEKSDSQTANMRHHLCADRVNIRCFERANSDGVAIQSHKLHFIALSTIMNVNNDSNITLLKMLLRKVAFQDNAVVFVDHLEAG